MNDVELLVDWIHDLARSVREEVGPLSVAELVWQPDAEANNIGVTVWHVARWLDMITVQVFANRPPEEELWHTRGWLKKTGYDPRGIGYKGLGVVTGYTQAEVQAIPIMSADDLLSYFDQACAALCDYLRALPPDALHQAPAPEPGRRTVYQSLKPILQGCFGHAGEIEALKAMHARTEHTQGGAMIEKVNLKQKFDLFQEYWSPRIAGELNDSYVKLAKFKGEFVWHHHANEDELFLVVKGHLTIKLRDQDIELDAGEFVIIPKGVEHLPVAEEEVQALLLEPKSTLNTGNVQSERTIAELKQV